MLPSTRPSEVPRTARRSTGGARPPSTTTTAKDHRSDTTGYRAQHDPARRVSTETKASFKTTELIAYVLAVLGVLIASAMVDENEDGQGFGAESAAAVLAYARDTLRLPRLLAIVLEQNTASVRLLKRLGLRYERDLQLPGSDDILQLYAIDWRARPQVHERTPQEL